MNSTNKPVLKIDWATHEAAKFACLNWHYSKTMPATITKPLRIGVWENDLFIGVIIFTVGVGATINSPYKIGRQEICELQRVALTKHLSNVSRMIAIAVKFLVSKCPNLRLIVSFADSHQGHHGGIYQAGNWIYSGITDESIAYFNDSGRQIHPRNVGKITCNDKYGVKKYGKDGLTKEARPGKHRYLMPLDAAMREQIAPLAKPYPKRTTRTKEQDAGHPPALGGAAPTRSLQFDEVKNGKNT